MWFIAGNLVGLSALMLVMLWIKPAGYSQMSMDTEHMQATPNTSSTQASKSPLGSETVNVVVANHDIGQGTVLSKSDLKLEPVPSSFTSEEFFVDPNKVIGRKTQSPLKAGDVLSGKMLKDEKH